MEGTRMTFPDNELETVCW